MLQFLKATKKLRTLHPFYILILTLILLERPLTLPIYAQGPATETTVITATNGVAGDYFGMTVDMDNGMAVIGAFAKNSNQGEAYLFERNAGGADTWGQVITFTPSVAGGAFGHAVRLDGDTLAVGAPSVSPDGAVYIYGRNTGGADNWGAVITLTVTGSGGGDDFGWSVALDDNTLVVGAVSANAAYVFRHNQGGANTWGQVATLTVTATAVLTPGVFGKSVAIADDTIIVGAPDSTVNGNVAQGAAFVFSRNTGGADNWGLTATLTDTLGATGDSLGNAVAINQSHLAVGMFNALGGNGAIKLYERNGGGTADSWTNVKTIGGTVFSSTYFGYSVAFYGDTMVVGANAENSNRGASYVFRRNRGGANNWGLDMKLLASDAAPNDKFGSAVVLDATTNTFLIGAVGANGNQGKAYIFNSAGNFWKEMASPVAEGGATAEYFGSAVSISGAKLLVGAPYADTPTIEAGEVYIYERNQTGKDGWGQVITLTRSSEISYDHFGSSVWLDNDTAIIGAPDAGIGTTNNDKGAAYIFERNQGGADNWGEVIKLTASDAVILDYFGTAVALSGDTAIVGAIGKDVGGNTQQGGAYIYERNQGGADNWGEVITITANDGAGGDNFGNAIAISGDTAIVGAYRADPGGNGQQGEAYIYERNQGGTDNWGQVITLTQGDGSDFFGYSVAIDGDTAAVVSSYAAPNGASTGAVYLYERNQGGADNWGLIATLSPNDLETYDWINAQVSISGDTVLVGAYAAGAYGKAYIFNRNEGGADHWGLSGVWESTDSTAARFSISAAIDANTVVLGDSYADVDGKNNQGRVYVFQLVVTPDLSISKSVTPTTANPGDTITYTLTYSNHGLIPAFGVLITDSIPISITNVSYTAAGATITPTGSISYAWNIADLSVGASGTITITGKLSSTLSAQTFVNTAEISATNEGWLDDNTASTLLSVGDVTVQGLTLVNDSPALTGETVQFTATITNGYNASYAWDFGEGPDAATGATNSYSYGVAGTYTAIVTASNEVSSQVATTTVVITEEAIAGLSVSGTTPVELGTDPNLQASITAGSNVRYDWNFGNGETCANCGNNPAMGLYYSYTVIGTYTAVVTASNTANLLTGSTTIDVTPAYNTFVYLPLILK